MVKLNKDVLYLIFIELQDDKNTLHSCLLVNKTWCETTIPILWKNPWKFLEEEKKLPNVIISHLSDNNFSQEITNSYQKPLFDYIRFCRYLNLNEIERIINITYKESKISIIRNEILNLFINENTRFTHFYIPYQFDCQIHLIPGAEHCFSELEFLHCNTSIKEDVLNGLMEMCKSIRILELKIERDNNNYGIFKLIETPKKLFDIRFLKKCTYSNDELLFKSLENSFTKSPTTDIPSSLKYLKRLEWEVNCKFLTCIWDCTKNLSLPFLQILKTSSIPIKALTSLIENTSGYLNEIKIDYITHDETDNKKIIQAIYQNCPNLKYLKLLFINNNIFELENLLINCQDLNGLCFWVSDIRKLLDWDNIFKILTRSSPTSLFKFKFNIVKTIKSDSLNLFFDNWRGRHPMLLQTTIGVKDLIVPYIEEGIIKRYDYYSTDTFEDFEWIQKK